MITFASLSFWEISAIEQAQKSEGNLGSENQTRAFPPPVEGAS
jgi:hypothetical protein